MSQPFQSQEKQDLVEALELAIEHLEEQLLGGVDLDSRDINRVGHQQARYRELAHKLLAEGKVSK